MGKIAFCYSGEGAKGAVQAGITLALHNKGIVPDVTLGTSSGGICAAGYAYQGAEKLAELWSNIKKMGDVFGLNWNFLWKSGLYNEKPLIKLLEKTLVGKPQCESIALRINLGSGELQYVSNLEVSNEDFMEVLLASVAIPVLVEGRDGWADAATRESAPLKKAITAGCDEIYIIVGKPFGLLQKVWRENRFFGFLHSGLRALEITLYEILMNDIAKCVYYNSMPGYRHVKLHIIEPETRFMGLLDFKKCKEGVQYGLEHNVEQDVDSIYRQSTLFQNLDMFDL